MWVRLGGVWRGSVCVSVCLALKGNEFKPLCSRKSLLSGTLPVWPSALCGALSLPCALPLDSLAHQTRRDHRKIQNALLALGLIILTLEISGSACRMQRAHERAEKKLVVGAHVSSRCKTRQSVIVRRTS